MPCSRRCCCLLIHCPCPCQGSKRHKHYDFNALRSTEEGLQLLLFFYEHLKPEMKAGYRIPHVEVVAGYNNTAPMHQDKFTGALSLARVRAHLQAAPCLLIMHAVASMRLLLSAALACCTAAVLRLSPSPGTPPQPSMEPLTRPASTPAPPPVLQADPASDVPAGLRKLVDLGPGERPFVFCVKKEDGEMEEVYRVGEGKSAIMNRGGAAGSGCEGNVWHGRYRSVP